MKLFGLFMAASAVNAERRSTRRENMKQWLTTGFGKTSGVRGAADCPPLELPENAVEIVYHEQTNPKVPLVAEAMCPVGFFPDLSGNNKLKTKCKVVKNKDGTFSHRWLRPLPKCMTCKVPDPTADIQAGEENMDVFCTYNEKTLEKHCQMRCLDDRKRIAHAILKGKTQKRANIDCRCKKGKCRWTSHGKPNLSLGGFKCQDHGAMKPHVPINCSTKEPTCAVVTPKVEQLNSWVCRNCFRIRAYYKFREFGVTDFDNQDYMDITFDEQVFWIKHSHPVESAEDIGNNTWRVRFSKFATFSNKEMDFSAELRAVSPKIPDLTIAKTCPCSGN